MPATTLADLDRQVTGCRRCPRLVAWREEVARVKRAAFANQTYWGRPVPGFGPPDARLLIVGLAPAAHGANRTGRMFTGDRSGDVLYAALHAVGLASQPSSVSVDDGLELFGTRITAPVRCAPPANKPTPTERDNCRPWLTQELTLLRPTLRCILALGAFGWHSLLPTLASLNYQIPKPRPAFTHAAHVELPTPDSPPLHLIGCYHVSQQNTFTNKLTPAMVCEVLRRARDAAGIEVAEPSPESGRVHRRLAGQE